VSVVSFGHAFGQAKNSSIAGLEKRARQGYRDHYAISRDLVPKDRLLEYKLGSGLEPLCEILGKPVPDEPFPHLNESKDMKTMFERVSLKALEYSAIYAALLLTLILLPVVDDYLVKD
jgi:hypothetical protein